MQAKRFTLCLPVILATTLGAASSTPEQFAYSAKLTESSQAMQRVELPVEVLLAATRADLGDVAVFDANGKALPCWIRPSVIPRSERQFGLPIYLFNNYQQNGSRTLTTREQNQQQGQLSESTITETLPVEQTRQDYVIGLPEAGEGLVIKSIELDWTHEPADQLLQLKVEAGNDLDNWRSLQSNKSLTNQSSDDPRWRRIDAVPKDVKYMRLTPINPVDSFELKQAIGTYTQESIDKKVWHRLEALEKMIDPAGYFEFSLPSKVAGLELRLIPAESQTLISGDLHAGHDGFDQKRFVDINIQQHNISKPDIEPSQPIKLPAQNYSHWWFKPDQTFISPPLAEIAYPVYEVLFLGNDNPPYSLAWGNHEAAAPANDLYGLLSPEQRYQPQAELVRFEGIEIAGGEARLVAETKIPWLKWMLWLLLASAVMITGKMAISLFRDMNASKTGE